MNSVTPVTMVDEERHRLATQMRGAFDIAPDVAKITESLFIKYYVPFFRGDLFAEGLDGNNDFLLENWFKLSGGPLREVKVIDPAGNTLFTVPPLATTAMFTAQRKDGATPFAEIVKMAHHYNLISPVAEQNHTNSSLEVKFKEMYSKQGLQISEREKMWYEILARYETVVPRIVATNLGVSKDSTAVTTALQEATKKADDKFSDDELLF